MKRPCRECKSAGTSRGVLGTCRGTVQNYVFRPNEATEASLFVHRCMDSCPAHKGGRRGRNGPKTGFFEKNAKKVRQLFGHLVRRSYFCTRNSGCSSARLEYASGGRVVAGSNPVTPTELPSSNDSILIESLLLFFYVSQTPLRASSCSTPLPRRQRKQALQHYVWVTNAPQKSIAPIAIAVISFRKASCLFVPLVVKLSAARLRVHSWLFVVKPIIRKASCLFVALCGTPQ